MPSPRNTTMRRTNSKIAVLALSRSPLVRFHIARASSTAFSHSAHPSGHSVANDEKLLREIEDNLALQEYAEKIKDLQQEISERKDSLMDLPSEKELSDLYSKLQRSIEKSNNDLQYLEGVMQSKQEQVCVCARVSVSCFSLFLCVSPSLPLLSLSLSLSLSLLQLHDVLIGGLAEGADQWHQ